MSRLALIDPAAAQGKAKATLDAIGRRLGVVPNLLRVLANSPAALDAYAVLSGALAGGTFDAKAREQLALAIAETNLCGYCLSAHAALGSGAGLSASEIAAARRGTATDPRIDAAVKFARAVVLQRGEISDAVLAAARAAGLADGAIVEIVATVAANVFTNYLNHVARTPIDFPEVKPGS